MSEPRRGWASIAQPCAGKDCGAQIVWAKTVKGKLMPVDLEPSPDGNVELAFEDGRMVARVHAQPILGVELRMPHHATCPNAADFRRRP